MMWLAWLGCVAGILALAIQVNAHLRISRERRRLTRIAQQDRRATDQAQRKAELDAEKRRAEVAVISGPWIIPTTCECGVKFDRPRMVSDNRCQKCREKAWENEVTADREDWASAPGTIRKLDGTEVKAESAGLIILPGWGEKK